MDNVYPLKLSASLTEVLQGISDITVRTTFNFMVREVHPLIRRKIFTLDSAIRVHNMAWQIELDANLSYEDAIALYKTHFLVKALWLLPHTKQFFEKSDWFTTWSDPKEIWDELMPETIENIALDLADRLSKTENFAHIKGECELAVEEVRGII